MRLLIFFLLFWKAFVWAAESPEIKPLTFSFDDFQVVNEDPKKEPVQNKKLEAIPAENTQENEMSISEKSALDEFFDKSLKVFDNLKRRGEDAYQSVIVTNQTPPVSKPKEDPAKKFPDPLFFDAIYNSQNLFYTYTYIYDDKTNKDNSHIPKLQNYDTYTELFLTAKTRSNSDKFYELFHSLRFEPSFNINEQDKFGNTLLLVSIRNGNFEVFYFLLNQGADPSICNKKDVCPIQIAVYSNNLNAIKALADKNVNLRVYDRDGFTPTQYTIYENRIEAFEILFERYLRYKKNELERIEMIDFAKSIGNPVYVSKIKTGFNVK